MAELRGKVPAKRILATRRLERWTFVLMIGLLFAWTVFVGPLFVSWKVIAILVPTSVLEFFLYRKIFRKLWRGTKDPAYWLSELAVGTYHGLLFLNLFLLLLGKPFPGLTLEETQAWCWIGFAAFYGTRWVALEDLSKDRGPSGGLDGVAGEAATAGGLEEVAVDRVEGT